MAQLGELNNRAEQKLLEFAFSSNVLYLMSSSDNTVDSL